MLQRPFYVKGLYEGHQKSNLQNVTVLLRARRIFRQEQAVGDRRQRVRVRPRPERDGPVLVAGTAGLPVGLGEPLALLGSDVEGVAEEDPVAASALHDEEDGVRVECRVHRRRCDAWNTRDG